ncbi:hypothetical protein HBI88_171200 [Parastagonospora nodorum]|nr:hypothetical protein HBH46_148580 [Parastagonospora nodorum]KAH4151502.1 hypothetical protein HBH43_241620 [Parastagonospora nodorum]KAH5426238.1 hypothetical protein HBI46_044550 [Parastagonospora nodorum]KAH5482429.1 hypothetical protein HBI28_000490 [Parastagonospora nodorum]KAH5647868.1 hypothetical protein HBI22_022970 [Parastagonospora nodorum]
MHPDALTSPNDNTVEDEHMRTLLDIPTEGHISLDETVLLFENVMQIFSNNEARERAFSDRFLTLAILGAVDKMLSLLNAAKSTYFNTNRCLSLDRKERARPPSLVCVKSTATIGRHFLNEEESDLIAREAIKALALRLGRETTNLKQWLFQKTGVNERGVFEMDEVEQMLFRIWAFVAAVRE